MKFFTQSNTFLFVLVQGFLFSFNFFVESHHHHFHSLRSTLNNNSSDASDTGSQYDSPQSTSAGSMSPMKDGWDTSGEYFASVWDSKQGGTYTAKADKGGKYSVDWNGVDGIVIGKGWKIGSKDRIVQFQGSFVVNGNGAYLSVYGWSANPCHEYYIVESWGEYKPCNGAPAENKGTYESDGEGYTACTIQRSSQCIDNSQGYVQFWSVRDSKRTSGTVTFANHVQAWEKFGMKLGSLTYPQIMATEAYGRSSGSSTISIEGSK